MYTIKMNDNKLWEVYFGEQHHIFWAIDIIDLIEIIKLKNYEHCTVSNITNIKLVAQQG